MSYGISCKNASGFTQIDGTYENLAVWASGTGTAGTTNTFYPIAFPSNTPTDYVMFAKPSTESGSHALWFSEFPSTSYSSFVIGLPYAATSTISIDWVIAIRSPEMPNNTSPGYGLEVYKSNGTDQVFSSNNGNFRCQQVAFDNITSVGATGTVFSVSNMAGVFSIMSGKSFVGKQIISSEVSMVHCNHAVFNYSANTIRQEVLPVQVVGGPSAAFGCGLRTNLIGTFT
jgi:hypothetical protein